MSAAPIKLPTWYRALAVIVGVFSIALAMVVLIDPVLGVAVLIVFLAFALLLVGFDRLIAGVSGHPFGSMVPMFPGGAGPNPPNSASGPTQNPPTKP